MNLAVACQQMDKTKALRAFFYLNNFFYPLAACGHCVQAVNRICRHCHHHSFFKKICCFAHDFFYFFFACFGIYFNIFHIYKENI